MIAPPSPAFALFSKNAVLVNEVGSKGISQTKELIATETPTIFQATFEWDDFFHKSDILIYNNELNGYELYEVKGSNSVKEYYINNLCFQKTIIEKNIGKTGSNYALDPII